MAKPIVRARRAPTDNDARRADAAFVARLQRRRTTTAKRQTRALTRTSIKVKRATDWYDAPTFSVLKQSEGGPGLSVLHALDAAGIPARAGYSCYVGHVGIEVPHAFAQRAERIIFGGK